MKGQLPNQPLVNPPSLYDVKFSSSMTPLSENLRIFVLDLELNLERYYLKFVFKFLRIKLKEMRKRKNKFYFRRSSTIR